MVPGSYQTYWFEATKPGRYHIFCAEYCGTNHSKMSGWVTVMEPAYLSELAGKRAPDGTMAEQGEKLFEQYGCVTCHVTRPAGPRSVAPTTSIGHPVELEDGRTVIADEAYLRESILNPNAKVVKGYQPQCHAGISRARSAKKACCNLIVYIKSLSHAAERRTGQSCR